jgi:SAM-dependent methyltransferase
MVSVSEHYDKHLGPVYRWMVGDVPAAVKRNEALLGGLLVDAKKGGLAVDLGPAIGLQTFALAKLGYFVLAVEECKALAVELRRETDAMQVRVAEDDLINFRRYTDEPAAVVVCMGDTLTHLDSMGVVANVIEDVANALEPGGVFITSFRDYSAERVGAKKTILVRGDDARILTCQLEYQKEHVLVRDLLHERAPGKDWKLKVSEYLKVRLSPAWVEREMARAGLEVYGRCEVSGMACLAAKKVRS